jgi:hypothetical protein
MSTMDASWKGWTDDELERAAGELTHLRGVCREANRDVFTKLREVIRAERAARRRPGRKGPLEISQRVQLGRDPDSLGEVLHIWHSGYIGVRWQRLDSKGAKPGEELVFHRRSL